MKYDVVTIGDAMKDIFVFPALDEMRGISKKISDKKEEFLVLGYGDKITINHSYESIGGTACNVAVGLKKIGLKTSIISACGKDDFGAEILHTLKNSHVDISNVLVKNNRKSSFSIIISYKGDRSILVYHSFEPKDFEIQKNLETSWLYLGPVGEDYQSLFAKITGFASEKNVKIAWNPGAVQIHDSINSIKGLLNVTSVLFLNRQEAQLLAGVTTTTNIKDIAKILHHAGPETVVITDGPNGAYVFDDGEFIKVGTYPGVKVEATGAGDAFASAFLAAKIKGEELLTCLKWGVTNSASVVGKYGAQQGLLSLSTIKTKVKEYKWPAKDLRFS